MYTTLGCSSLKGYGNLGQSSPAFTDVEYKSLVQYLWNKYKTYALTPDIPGIPEINLGSIIPGTAIENMVVAYFIQETEKVIKEAADIKDTVKVSNLSKILATFAVNELRNAVVAMIGEGEAASLSKMTITEVMDNIGEFINPLYVVFICLDEHGPTNGGVRNTVISEISGKLQKQIVDFAKQAFPGYELPVEETEMEIFSRNANSKAIELASSTVFTTMEATWKKLFPVYHVWLESNAPTWLKYGQPQIWQGVKASWTGVLMQELKKAQTTQATTPQRFVMFMPRIEQPKLLKKPTMFFKPTGIIKPSSAGIPILPLAIGGVVILFLLKKKK